MDMDRVKREASHLEQTGCQVKERRPPRRSAHPPAARNDRRSPHRPVLSVVLWCLQWCYTICRILPPERPVWENFHRLSPPNNPEAGGNGAG